MTESKLREALDVLDHGNRWLKGDDLIPGSGYRVCIIGALAVAWEILDPETGDVTDTPWTAVKDSYLADFDRLASTLKDEGYCIAWSDEHDGSAIVMFNDQPATSWGDVETLFKKTIQRS